MEIQELRQSIRREKLQQRNALPEQERAVLSLSIQEKTLQLLSQKEARFVHIYLSFRSEVATHVLVERLLQTNIEVAVPIIETSAAGDQLLHSTFTAGVEIKAGKYGIPEPVKRVDADLPGIDTIILPLAAFDRKGTRLGYGRGFYDRFLQSFKQPVRKIGLAFSIQEAELIPAMPHDVPLDVIVTEKEVIEITAA